MIKRLPAFMLTVLLLAALLPAQAESLPVYRILDVSREDDPQLLGCGVLFRDQQSLLTALPALPEGGTIIAYGADGVIPLADAVSFGDLFQMLILALPSEQQPMQLADLDDALCLGLSTDNEPISLLPEQVQETIMTSLRLDARQVTLNDALLPGAFLSDGENVGGIVVSKHPEGEGRYTLLTAEGMRPLLSIYDDDDMRSYPWISRHVRTAQEGCSLVIDWSQLDLSAAAEGDQVWTIVAMQGNCYLEGCGTDIAEGRVTYSIVPGCTYDVYAYVGPENPSAAAQGAVSVTAHTAPGAPYADHDYADTSLYLGVSGEGQAVDAGHPADPIPAMTVDALRNADHVWLQVTSAYQVDEPVSIEGCIALVTPENYVLAEPVSFELLPDLADGDVWAYPLDRLLEIYAVYGEGPAAGSYTIAYFFGSQLVSVYEFELE